MNIFSYDDLTPTGRPSQLGEPTWELTAYFPRQGDWTEEAYFGLESRGGRLIELVDGKLEFPSMPTGYHQFIVEFLLDSLKAYVKPRGLGVVMFAPCPVRLRQGNIREPDIFFVRRGRWPDFKKPPDGVDLAIEVVSDDPSDRKRDLVEKRKDYAQAGIPEYWIVDPLEQRITVLVLDGEQYRVDGEYSPGQKARSKLLEGLEIDVAAVFAAGELRETP
ncbi:MAG TPA: Uma2 family endonuclease [Pirellulaceae bacterium]|nr:Uma2 family endonuclease [Pirellulaceae bacterium]